MAQDLYNVLGVDKNASEDDIKKAYRKMAMKYHPDRNHDPEAEANFKKAAEAYDVLSDNDKKSNYDRFGSVEGGNPFAFGGQGFGFDYNDIFSQFGNMFGGDQRQQQRQQRGSDLRIKVSLTIEEIITGTTKKLKYKRQETCEPCNGKGGSDVRQCIPCSGSGQRTVVQNTPFGQIRNSTSCPDCSGSGKQVANKCVVCHGLGTTSKEQTVDVEIPKGVGNGMQLNMARFGNMARDGVSGDLHILIDEIRNPLFRREGGNLIIDKEISILDAIMGSNIKLNTPHGDVVIAITPGTEHGSIIRIGGKGIPDIHQGMGNLVVIIKVNIPKHINLDEKAILEKLKNSPRFNVV